MTMINQKPKDPLARVKKILKPAILTAFSTKQYGEHAMTRAILCRNELNHKAGSSSTRGGAYVSLPSTHEAVIERVGMRSTIGWRVVAVPR